MTESLFSRAAAIPVGHNNKKTVQSIKGAGWNFLFISSWLHSPAVLKFVHVNQEDTQNILQQYAIGWEKMKFHTVVTPSTVMHVDPLECFLLSSLLHKALKCGHTEKKKSFIIKLGRQHKILAQKTVVFLSSLSRELNSLTKWEQINIFSLKMN